MIITFRVINSFEYQTVFYMPLDVSEQATLPEVQYLVNAKILQDSKFRAARGKVGRFNIFKEFTRPGVAKTGELCIYYRGEEWPIVEGDKRTLNDMNWEHGMEVSYYIANERY